MMMKVRRCFFEVFLLSPQVKKKDAKSTKERDRWTVLTLAKTS
jgi:hypothetical protein